MNERKEIRFIDLFSGIGGFRLGLQKAGSSQSHVIPYESKYQTEDSASRRGMDSRWDRIKASGNNFRCVWSCDNNRYANQVYAKNFGEENHFSGDVRGVDPATIPDFDLLCAGFPCQAFSVAGKRKGFEDTRGTIFFEICRIAEAKRPALLLLENVRGLLSHARGETFHTILQSLEGLGYWVEWQVLNSKHFGVPQNRQRVFIVGHSRNGSSREIFPITEAGEYLVEAQEETRGEGSRIRDEHNSVSRSLRVGGSGREENLIVYDIFNKSVRADGIAGTLKGEGVSGTSLGTGIARTISRRYYKDGSENLIQVGTLGEDNQASRVYSADGLSPTIPTPGGGHHMPKIVMPIDGMRIRRLTPVECERLQNFPDDWTKWGINDRGEEVIVSDTQRYKTLGNAVTTSVITFLGGRIMGAWS